jgi:hypothetical protein
MPQPKVTRTRAAFSMGYGVEVNILADPSRGWGLLTDAQGFPRWNSTVSGIEGRIQEGERLGLRVPGTDRTFTPRVSGVVPQERMTWTGGCAFMLKGRTDGATDFSMNERFFGLMLPLVKRSMPDLGPVFERFASDLKREAEPA